MNPSNFGISTSWNCAKKSKAGIGFRSDALENGEFSFGEFAALALFQFAKS